MAIVHYLLSLDPKKLPHIPPLRLDDLQDNVRANLFLELPQSDGSNCLVSPALNSVGNNHEDRVEFLLQEKSAVLDYLKDRLMQAMVLDTAIIETTSYFIEQNHHLVLARLKYFKEIEKLLEIKLYTATKKDLANHYSDKLYIGRCFINLETPELSYRGLNLYVLSLMDQYELLKHKAETRLGNQARYKNYFVEIQELISDVVGEVIRSLDTVPTMFTPDAWDLPELVRTKARYRSIVHLLLELADEVNEFENVLRFNKEDQYARYVTKYRKDLKNIISTINLNVLAMLSGKIQER